jgi:type I restriction enzyme R subunit
MNRPTEHKTVQARILKYVQEIGWTYVPRGEAERRRGFDPAGVTPEEVLPQRNTKENAR